MRDIDKAIILSNLFLITSATKPLTKRLYQIHFLNDISMSQVA